MYTTLNCLIVTAIEGYDWVKNHVYFCPPATCGLVGKIFCVATGKSISLYVNQRITEESLKRAAFRYLERYNASTHSLRQFLKSQVIKAINTSTTEKRLAFKWIGSLIEALIESKLLDDKAFAENRARIFFERGISTRMIIARLTEKGIDQSLIKVALKAAHADYEVPDFVAAIRYAKRKRIGPFRNQFVRNENKQKDLRILARVGFDFTISRAIIDSANSDQLEVQII